MSGRRRNKAAGQYSLSDYQLREVHVRLCLKEGDPLYSEMPISGAYDAVNVMRDVLKELDREMVCAVNLDNRLKPINYNIVSVGDVNTSLVPIQNVFKSSILSNAAAIILLHNHPSGDPSPSKQDLQVTEHLAAAGKLINIPLMDHVIVGGMLGDLYSFRGNHPELFSDEIDLDYIRSMTNELSVRESILEKLTDLQKKEPCGTDAPPRHGRREEISL